MPNTSTIAQFTGGIHATTLAAVGTTLSGSPELSSGVTKISTGASDTAVRLPLSWPAGSPVVVANSTATTALVFPNTSAGIINGASAGASYSIAQNKGVAFYCIASNVWVTAGA